MTESSKKVLEGGCGGLMIGFMLGGIVAFAVLKINEQPPSASTPTNPFDGSLTFDVLARAAELLSNVLVWSISLFVGSVIGAIAGAAAAARSAASAHEKSAQAPLSMPTSSSLTSEEVIAGLKERIAELERKQRGGAEPQ